MKSGFDLQWYLMCQNRRESKNNCRKKCTSNNHKTLTKCNCHKDDCIKPNRLFGCIRDCNNCPIANISLILIRCCHGERLILAKTRSNCQGFFQFNLLPASSNAIYKVAVAT